MALIDLQAYTAAYDDLQAVWKQDLARQQEIEAAINANPALAAYIIENPTANADILALITPGAHLQLLQSPS